MSNLFFLEEKKQFFEQIESLRLECIEFKKNNQSLTEYYDSMLTDSKAQIERLESEINEIKFSKADLENANTYLTEQIRLLRQNLEEISFGKSKEVLFKKQFFYF